VRRLAKALFWTIAALLLTAQFMQPWPSHEREQGDRTVWDDPAVTPEVKAILARSCADCHSDKTRWPWYARVAPVSWLVVQDVEHGRRKLNLSDWPLQSQNETEEIGDAVASKNMPPWRYVLLHPQSRLSNQDRVNVDRWVDEHFKSSEISSK
jgi:hypothetical protein